MTHIATTTCKRRRMVRKFLNAESGVVFNQGRMVSVETDEGIVLASYANEVIARISEDGSDVELFTGHHSQVSKTTTEHIKVLGSVLSNTEGKSVSVYKRAPTLGIGARASRSAQYINNFVGSFDGGFSPVELDAREEVEDALQERLQQLLGE